MADLQAESTLSVQVEGESAVTRLAAAFANLQQQATSVQQAVSVAGGAASAAALQNQVDTFNRRANQQAEQLGNQIGNSIGGAIRRVVTGPLSTMARAVNAVTGGLGNLTFGMSGATVAMVGLGAAVTGLAVPIINLVGGFKMLRSSFTWAQQAAEEQIRVSARTRRFYPQLMGEALEAAEGEMRVRMSAAAALFGEGADQMQEQITRRMSNFRLGRGIRGERDIFARWGITQETVRQFESGGRRLDVMGWLEQFTLKREDLERRLAQATTPQEKAMLVGKLSLLADDTTKIFGQRFADMVQVQQSSTLRQLSTNMRRALPLGETENAKQKAIDFQVSLASLKGTLWSIALGIGGDVQPQITTAMNDLNKKLLDTTQGGDGLGRALRDLGRSMANSAWKALRELMARIKPETVNEWIKAIDDWKPGPTIDNIGKVFTAIFEIGKAIGDIITAVGKLWDSLPSWLKDPTGQIRAGKAREAERAATATPALGPAERAQEGLEASRSFLGQSAGAAPAASALGPGQEVTPTFGPSSPAAEVATQATAIAAQADAVASEAQAVATQAQAIASSPTAAVAAPAGATEALAAEAELPPIPVVRAPTAPLEPGAYHWTEPTPPAATPEAPPAYAWPGEGAGPVAAPAAAVPTATPWFETAPTWPAAAPQAATVEVTAAAEPPAAPPAATPWEPPAATAAAPAPSAPMAATPAAAFAWTAPTPAAEVTAPPAYAWSEPPPVVAATGAGPAIPGIEEAYAWPGTAAAPGPPEEPAAPAAYAWGAAPNRYGRPLPEDTGAAQQALQGAAAGSALATMTDIERTPGGDQLVMKTEQSWLTPERALGVVGRGAMFARLATDIFGSGAGSTALLALQGAAEGGEYATGGYSTKWATLGSAIPGIGIAETIHRDAQQGHPLRTWLRGMLGIEDPGEPAPWQPGGQFHPDTEDLTAPVADREGEWGGITAQDGSNFGAAAAESLRENLRGYAIPHGPATTSYGVAPRSAPKPTGGDTATEA